MAHFLCKTVGSWSPGTRVEVIDWAGSLSPFEVEEGILQVRVLAGDNPIIDVDENDVIERRPRARAIT